MKIAEKQRWNLRSSFSGKKFTYEIYSLMQNGEGWINVRPIKYASSIICAAIDMNNDSAIRKDTYSSDGIWEYLSGQEAE